MDKQTIREFLFSILRGRNMKAGYYFSLNEYINFFINYDGFDSKTVISILYGLCDEGVFSTNTINNPTIFYLTEKGVQQLYGN